MVSYLQVEGLAKSYGDRLLFSDVTFGVYQGDKIGLVAQNGAGKSTLMGILAGKESPDEGSVVFRNGLRIGYLEQTPVFAPEATVLEAAMPSVDVVANEDWNLEDRAKSMLGTLGLHDTDAWVSTLSGGQQKRLAIVRTLLAEPDFLFLDEPTNHLDIAVIEWLEDYLTRQRITLLMVTHDRYFLDRVCSKIMEIDRGQTYVYEGNFSYYLRRREERMEALSSELSRVKNLLRTELEWMRRQPQARGSKAKYRIDNFHDLERRSKVDLSERNVSLNMKSSYIGSKIFEARGVTKSFGDIRILRDWSYTFARYERVGIVGDNGAGKTTFIKLLLGEIEPDSGHFDIGETVRWGYYSQAGMTGFDERKKVIDAVREIAEEVTIDDKTRLSASQFLSQFLFSPEQQQKYIYKLSGGERRRLYLATVLMRRPNFLILDEPTNDLDIMTLTVLEDYLAGFKGCLIVVSHDRFFLDRIVDHLFVFKGNGVVRDFPGDYTTYRESAKKEEREARIVKENTDGEKPSGRVRQAQDRQRLTFKEKREKEELERQLEEYYAEKTALESELNSGESDHLRLGAIGERINELTELIDEAEMRLLELMEKED